MAEEAGEKSHEATAHRRQQAREEGQVAQSQDLASAALLIGTLITLLYCGTQLTDFFGLSIIEHLGGDAWLSADRDFVVSRWTETTWKVSRAIAPILGFIFVLGAGVHLMQVGFLYLPDKLMPDLSNISPLSGFKRLFSTANAVRLGFGIIKIIIVGAVAYSAVDNRREEILATVLLDTPEIAIFTWEVCVWTSLKIAFALLILGLLDYGFQWWKHEKDLSMTGQEVREEMRNLQGDPQILSRRKQVQRQLAMQRMSSSVPKADVVITNPTELAIAIQYDAKTMAAPIIVAKGAGVIAARIRALALENGIPIVEKKPLAQALYKQVDLNHPIPDTLYAGVAEVLAYVYQLKGKPLPEGK